MSKLGFSDYNRNDSMIPPAPLNGGLYMGEKFAGPWGNIDIKPDVVNMTRNGLKLTEVPPPEEAFNQYGDIFRPGNNEPDILGKEYTNDKIACLSKTSKKSNTSKCMSFDPNAEKFLNL